MMGKIVEHFITGLQQDFEHLKEQRDLGVFDSEARKKKEVKLYQQLAELIETERKYVQDLEQVCADYSPLLRVNQSYSSLDRKKPNKIKRKVSQIMTQSEDFKNSLNPEMLKQNLGLDMLTPSFHEVRQMLGNLEDIKDYHKKILLPKLEEAVGSSSLMRALFQEEEARLSKKYGRYCINNTRASIIIEQYIKFFSFYQHNKGIKLRIDAMLIKPIQRLTRYHMFLTSLSKTCKQLGFLEASEDFNSACEFISSSASHTNTMMWIGKMENCNLDLSGQGQLLKHGLVSTKPLLPSTKKGRKWSTSSQKASSCYLFLFQQTLVLCRKHENHRDELYYACHSSVNKMRIRDTIGEDLNLFEVHKLEDVKVGISGIGDLNTSDVSDDTEGAVIMRLECQSENEKNSWVRAINTEIKQLRTMAKTLSSQFLFMA